MYLRSVEGEETCCVSSQEASEWPHALVVTLGTFTLLSMLHQPPLIII